MTDPADPTGPADPAGEARRRRSAQKIQDQLDEALADSFPASDPVSIVTSHEEEDWGDAAPPPAPQAGGAKAKER
jgi:hypothetical protein